MKKLNYIFLILMTITTQIVSYGQADELLEKLVLKDGECEFEYLKRTNYLNSSFQSILPFKNNKKVKYLDENGKTHKFSSGSEKLPIWCEYEWVCDIDTTVNQKFYVARPTFCKTLTSKSNNIKLKYCLSAVVNSDEPKLALTFYM